MNTQEVRYDNEEEEMEMENYEFACPACWAVRTVSLTPGAKRPMCDCGTPLSASPITEPQCAFCAARQTPIQHRLWCAIYFLRNCNCGYGQRP